MTYIGREPTRGEFKKVDVSSWTFNDSATTFALGFQVGEVNQLLVSLNGVIQQPTTDFILADGGTNLVFTTAPAAADSCFVVKYGDVGGVSIPDGSITAAKLASSLKTFTEDYYTANGTQSSFTLTEAPSSENAVLVSIDGIVQANANYSITGTTLTFDSNLDSGSNLRVLHYGIKSGVITPTAASVTRDMLTTNLKTVRRQALGTGSSHTLNYTPTDANSILLFVNGLYQTPDYNYSVSGTSLTLGDSVTGADSAHVLFLGGAYS